MNKTLRIWAVGKDRIALLVLLFLLAGCARSQSPTEGVTAEGYPYKGSLDAPVLIEEFSDFQCPYCAMYVRETFPQIDKKYIETGKVRYIFRQLPLSFHRNALPAAEASLCAADQGKFWPMHDRLFGEQAQWSNRPDAALYFKQMAGQLGLDRARFDACLDSHQNASRVDADIQAAVDKGARGTPYFLVGGHPLSGAHPFANFEKVIEAALK
ncbi:MAG: DsbA family protein [Anaerolineae bacterium]